MWEADMAYRRILTVQDISCLGQCSATVALPILSACGHETCILPTMVLSTHTGGLGTPTRRDLTGDLLPIAEHWKQQGIDFDCIYAGYLGKPQQVQMVAQIADRLLRPGGKLIVDPAMADHGKLYSGISPEYVEEMKALCRRADVILPNLTEGCMLSGLAYRPQLSQKETERLLARLERGYGGTMVLTGAAFREGETGFALHKGGVSRSYSRPLVGKSYHGTGDMFASVFTGALLQDWDVFDAAVLAAEFVARAVENTYHNPAHEYGVKFETALPWLVEQLLKGR